MTRKEEVTKEDVWKFAIHCMELGYGADILKQYTASEAMAKLEKFKKLEQIAPCEDAISRDETWKLLDDFNSYLSNISLRDVNESNCKDTIEWIRIKAGELRCNIVQNLPSVQPKAKSEWIPVGKDLPEVGEEVLVTRQLHFWDQDEPENDVDMFLYAGKSDEGPMFLAHDGQYLFGVTAWMPKPDPYKESEE